MSSVSATNTSRRRDRPIKKWKDVEVKKIVNYIRRNKNFEKPTARVYYNKLIQKTGITATWQILKFKVRYMKIKYFKMRDWRLNNIAKTQDQQTLLEINENVKLNCPFFNELEEIFGGVCETNYSAGLEPTMPCDENPLNVIIKSEKIAVDDEMFEMTTNEKNIETAEEFIKEDSMEYSIIRNETKNTGIDTEFTTVENQSEETNKNESEHSRNALDRLLILETKRDEFRERKFQFEKEKFEKEYEIELRKLNLEEERNRNEFEIRRLELEQKERIAKYEIEFKYTNNYN